MDVVGRISKPPVWHPYLPHFGHFLDVRFTFSAVLWPWSGFLALHLTVMAEADQWEGVAQGHVTLAVRSGEAETELLLPIKVTSDFHFYFNSLSTRASLSIRCESFRGRTGALESFGISSITFATLLATFLATIFA